MTLELKRIEIKPDRQYRNFDINLRSEEQSEMIIEGYAVVFNEPTVLYEFGGIQYKEIIDRAAFDGVSLKDVVLNYNHGGKPVARTKNGTLLLTIDAIGLKIRANLAGTEQGRELYEEIKGGYLDKMSFAFSEELVEYNEENHTRIVKKIKRLYDTAVVDFPAYESTSVHARSVLSAVAEQEAAAAVAAQKAERERLEHEQERKQLILKIKSKF